MATLTVRNLDAEVKHRLRVAAAQKGVSMEEHVRSVLEAAVRPTDLVQPSLWDSLRSRFAGLGDIALDLPDRAEQPRAAQLER